MIKVSKLADYGSVIMVYMAKHRNELHNARDIAEHTKIALPTVSKILKKLMHNGLLTSQRGTKGGYSLSRDPDDISVIDILAALDGKFAITDCSIHAGICQLEPVCSIKSNWLLINRAIYQALKCITLADMAKPLMKGQIAIKPEHILNQSADAQNAES